MTHDEIVQVLAATYPGVEWSYDGDGSTLDPVDGESLGLVWNDASAPPTLATLEAALAQVQSDVAAAATAAAWVELRMKRDRWIALIQPILDEVAAPGSHPSYPQARLDEIAANAAAWSTFAQELRDLPANTADPADPTWPTLPPAPVVHLT